MYELTQRGLALLQRFDRPGNIDGAIQSFERAISADPKYTPAHAGIARAYTRQADSTRDAAWATRAVDAARHAIELDPYLADAQVSLGLSLTEAGDYQHADEALRKALSLDPNNGNAWLGLGQIAYLQDRRTDAKAHFQQALALTPDDWQPARGLGNLSFRAGDYDDAIRWYTRAIGIAPDNAITYGVLGGTYHMKGDFASAATALQKSISIRPTSSAYSNLGTTLFYAGRFRSPWPHSRRGVELNPNTPMMWGNLGDAYRWTPGGRERAGDVEYTGVYTVVHKTVGADGHKTITIPDGPTSSIDILIFDTTGDTTVRTLDLLSLQFNQNKQPADPFAGAGVLRGGLSGTDFTSSVNSGDGWRTTIYSKGGKKAQQGWEINNRFQPFDLTESSSSRGVWL